MQKIPFEEVNVNYEIIQYWRPGVMEGVMMMNKDRYSVAVRRPDGEIEVKVEQHKPLTKHKGL